MHKRHVPLSRKKKKKKYKGGGEREKEKIAISSYKIAKLATLTELVIRLGTRVPHNSLDRPVGMHKMNFTLSRKKKKKKITGE